MDKTITREIMQSIYEIMADDNFINAVTTMYWKLFKGFQEKGFTEEQALKIIQTFALHTKT